MYGIVNKAIEELVISNFGHDKWTLIKEKSGIDIDYFISTEPYDDAVTYLLAQAVAVFVCVVLSYAFAETRTYLMTVTAASALTSDG